MLRGYAPAILVLAAAPAIAAQQTKPPLPCPAQPSAGPTSAPPAVPADQSSSSQQTPPADAWHCLTVQFDYDFNQTPPCTGSKPKHPCAAQFAIYETTAGTNKKNRRLLFNVPLPAKLAGVVPITGVSPKQIDFVLGWHKLGVGALDDTGKDSHMKFCDSCATWINVQAGPTPTLSTPAPGTSVAPPGFSPPPSPSPPAHP